MDSSNQCEKTIEWIFEHGKQYMPTLPWQTMPRGMKGECFDTCLMTALRGRARLKYVEGFARDPLDPSHWILHAWVTDGTAAFDLTWRSYDLRGKEVPIPTLYVGVEMDPRKAAKFCAATEYKGILANCEKDMQLAADCLPDGFPLFPVPSKFEVEFDSKK